MALSLIVFAGFYPPARRAIGYADVLAQALGGQLVLPVATLMAGPDAGQFATAAARANSVLSGLAPAS